LLVVSNAVMFTVTGNGYYAVAAQGDNLSVKTHLYGTVSQERIEVLSWRSRYELSLADYMKQLCLKNNRQLRLVGFY